MKVKELILMMDMGEEDIVDGVKALILCPIN